MRIKYAFIGFNYHLSDVNVVNFKKIHRKVSEQQLFYKWNSKTEVSNMENTDSERSRVCPTWRQKRQVSAERLLRTRSTFSKSVMESVAVSLLGTTELIFIEPGIKINGAHYRDVLLGQHLLPAIRSAAGDFFTYNALAQ